MTMMNNSNPCHPGPILLFGSGETLASSGKAYEYLAKIIGAPLMISILETPAGFQLNSEKVARNVGDFLAKRLQNYQPKIEIIPARHKNTNFSPNDEQLLKPMLKSNWIFMGPGSPSYTIQHLENSRAYHYLHEMHLNGCAVCLASAAVLAVSTHTLPVYEIFKVGQDPHWINGLNFLSEFGLNLTFMPHWNNHDGGKELDTSRCFMGVERFEKMKSLLPKSTTIVGIDEQTALLMDFDQDASSRVFGKGTVTLLHGSKKETYSNGEVFSMKSLGNFHLPQNKRTIGIRHMIRQARMEKEPPPPLKVQKLVKLRDAARARDNWEEADQLRKLILAEGWQVTDKPDGTELKKIS